MAVKIDQKKLSRIIVPFGMRNEIARDLDCTPVTVWHALNGRNVGRKGMAARRLAELKLKELNR
ncbi:MAG: hypothetical protein LBL04_14110 [Bacteroidales bacterium]|jgi:hypothetical protein|nr:hypothetical protein [Bacteroidales bacterium]